MVSSCFKEIRPFSPRLRGRRAILNGKHVLLKQHSTTNCNSALLVEASWGPLKYFSCLSLSRSGVPPLLFLNQIFQFENKDFFLYFVIVDCILAICSCYSATYLYDGKQFRGDGHSDVFMKLREVTLLEAVTTAIVKKPERISALGRTEGGLFSFFFPFFYFDEWLYQLNGSTGCLSGLS